MNVRIDGREEYRHFTATFFLRPMFFSQNKTAMIEIDREKSMSPLPKTFKNGVSANNPLNALPLLIANDVAPYLTVH